MVYIALKKEESAAYVGVAEVSEEVGSPKAFTAKILQQLSKADLVESLRGPNGGFYLPDNKKVFLADIIRVIDGDQLLDGCILGFEECSEDHPCPVHSKLSAIRDNLKGVLLTTNLEEMRKIIEDGEGYIKD